MAILNMILFILLGFIMGSFALNGLPYVSLLLAVVFLIHAVYINNKF